MKAIRKLNILLLVVAFICTIVFTVKQANYNTYGDYDKKMVVDITDITVDNYGGVDLSFKVTNNGKVNIKYIELDIRILNATDTTQSVTQAVTCSIYYLESLDSENFVVTFYTTSSSNWLKGKSKSDLTFDYRIDSVTFENGKIYENENTRFNSETPTDDPSQNNHTHSYTITKSNEYMHWQECGCGAKQNEVVHVYYNTKTNESKHWKECSCGSIQNEEAHTFTTKSNEYKHWQECECRKKQNEEAHTFTTKTNESKHWEECSCGAKKNEVAHTYTTKTNESKHWKECSCGRKVNEEKHTSNGSYCTTCNYTFVSTSGVVYDKSADGTYAEVIAYNGTDKVVCIANTYQGVPVKTIYNEAFKNTNITSVIIPNSVEYIGDSAFYSCDSLQRIVIPDNVTSIGYGAFRDCDSLQSVEIGNSVTSIGDYAFYSCDSLQSAEIGNSVTGIGDYVFYSCDSLQSVVIPDSVTSIGEDAFAYCDSLQSVVIPDSVTSIGEDAFFYCENLTNVTIGNSVRSIGSSAFGGCSKLFTEKDYITYVKANGNAYYMAYSVTNKNLSSYTIQNTTKILGNGLFFSCVRLGSITIPDGVEIIDNSAFYNCNSLQSVVIPDSVTWIGYEAFYYCTSLKNIYCEAESQPAGWSSSWKSGCNAAVTWGYKG